MQKAAVRYGLSDDPYRHRARCRLLAPDLPFENHCDRSAETMRWTAITRRSHSRARFWFHPFIRCTSIAPGCFPWANTHTPRLLPGDDYALAKTVLRSRIHAHRNIRFARCQRSAARDLVTRRLTARRRRASPRRNEALDRFNARACPTPTIRRDVLFF